LLTSFGTFRSLVDRCQGLLFISKTLLLYRLFANNFVEVACAKKKQGALLEVPFKYGI